MHPCSSRNCYLLVKVYGIYKNTMLPSHSEFKYLNALLLGSPLYVDLSCTITFKVHPRPYFLGSIYLIVKTHNLSPSLFIAFYWKRDEGSLGAVDECVGGMGSGIGCDGVVFGIGHDWREMLLSLAK